jgi:hypothetical protein
MKPRTRVTIEEAARAYKRLADQITKEYPKESTARSRTEVVGLAIKMVNLATMLVSALESLPPPPEHDQYADLLKVDLPIRKVREYLGTLIEGRYHRPGPWQLPPGMQDLRERLAREPKSGNGLIDACYCMLLIVLCYLEMQIAAETSTMKGFLGEGIDDLIDEAARAEIPLAKKNKTFARMKLFLDDADADCDPLLLDDARQDTGRRRKRIERPIEEAWPDYQKQLDEAMKAVLASLPDDSAEARETRATWATLSEQSNLQARRQFKRWLTIQFYVNPWATEGDVAERREKRRPAAK